MSLQSDRELFLWLLIDGVVLYGNVGQFMSVDTLKHNLILLLHLTWFIDIMESGEVMVFNAPLLSLHHLSNCTHFLPPSRTVFTTLASFNIEWTLISCQQVH